MENICLWKSLSLEPLSRPLYNKEQMMVHSFGIHYNKATIKKVWHWACGCGIQLHAKFVRTMNIQVPYLHGKLQRSEKVTLHSDGAATQQLGRCEPIKASLSPVGYIHKQFTARSELIPVVTLRFTI